MAFQKYSEEKRNEILDSQQEKNARGKISLLLNLGFPKDWIEKMLPYINEDTTSWQLRMISLFDQDPEDLVAMLEDSVKNSSVEIFQSIRKKYYIEKKSSADIEQIQKSMEQYVPLIHNQLDAYNEMSALLQQQFAVQQEKDDLHKSKGDPQERINAMQKENEKIFFISCRIQRKKKFPFSNNSLMRLNRCRNLRELQLLMKNKLLF